MAKKHKAETQPSPDGSRELFRKLTCALTVDEITAHGRALAEAEAERTKVDAARKAAAADYRAQIGAIDTTIDRLTAAVNSGEEEREVQCLETPDHARGEWVVTRVDTGEVIDTRPFSADERQSGLPFDA